LSDMLRGPYPKAISRSMTDDLEAEVLGLFRDLGGQVFGYCLRRLGRRELAEEAVSQVFLLLVKRYSSLRQRGQEGIRNWLFGTASNVVAKHLRQERRQQKIAQTLAVESSQSYVASETDRLDWPVLHEALRELSVKDQEVLTLRYFSGLTTRQIAEVLGIRHVTVRARLSRAIDRLREKAGKAFG
jgi:RNA polymerase sigma-70 factor (ECF subfamily)